MKVKIKDIKANPNNPRVIRDEQFKKLVKSIQEFPEMLSVRKLVCTPDMIVLGGNMRLKALQSAGIKEVDVEIVDWDEQKQKEFIIKDNVSFGEWNHEQLANEWDAIQLQEWGLDLPVNMDIDEDYSDKNKEIDIDELDKQMSIKLNFTEDEYWIVKEQLAKIASTPEQAVWKLLGND
jgi:ParB-like chromosome segregation protein Spo0J